MNRSRLLATALCLIFGPILFSTSPAAAAPPTASHKVPVMLWGEPLQLNLVCWGDPVTDGTDLLLLHGANHNTNVFYPLAMTLLSAGPWTGVGQICALDLPAHGESDVPSRIGLAHLGLDHYAAVVAQVLKHTNTSEGAADGVPDFEAVCGHSMGGMILQLLQTRLMAAPGGEGGLKEAFGIDRVMLMAATLPEGVAWEYGTLTRSDLQAEKVPEAARMLAFSQELGLHVALPMDLFVQSFLTYEGFDEDLEAGELPYSRADVWALSDVESLTAWAQLYGIRPRPGAPSESRPHVEPGAFANGYHLVTVGFRMDGYIQPCEMADLHVWLDGSMSSAVGGEPGEDGAPATLSYYCSGETPLTDEPPPGHFEIDDALATHDGFWLTPGNTQLMEAFMALKGAP